jgi:sarcosine oxidase subunit beta
MDRRETSVFLPQVARRMVELMPRLAALRVRRTWRGLYPMTPDGMPIVGEVEGLAGFINAAGMCGQGFMLGPGLAVYLRRFMTGGEDEETTAVLAQLTPQRSFKTEEKLK